MKMDFLREEKTKTGRVHFNYYQKRTIQQKK